MIFFFRLRTFCTIIMANALIACSLSTPIRASSGSESNKSEPNRIKPPSSSSSSSTNWWAPLFGWSSDPGYINNVNNNKRNQLEGEDPDNISGRPGSRFFPGCFTEEKAKQLRRKTAESSSFHDVMYHSALASRLASDMSVWPEKWPDRVQLSVVRTRNEFKGLHFRLYLQFALACLICRKESKIRLVWIIRGWGQCMLVYAPVDDHGSSSDHFIVLLVVMKNDLIYLCVLIILNMGPVAYCPICQLSFSNYHDNFE